MLYMPNLRGRSVHAARADAASLERALRAHGYEVYVLDGSRIVDERTFREEVTRALGLAEWGAAGGDAFRDTLFDVAVRLPAYQALIWRDADLSWATDAQAFLDGFGQLYEWAWDRRAASAGVLDRRLFLLGQGKGFTMHLSL